MSAKGAADAASGKHAKAGPEVIEHWFTLVPAQQFSANDFYAEIQKEISAQKIPALDIARVEIPEGGPLSDNREYLQMKRERLTFDVCAAPVGVNYFFSYRFFVEEVKVRPWQIAVVIAALWFLLNASIRHVGIFLGPTLLLAILCLLGWTMRNAIGLGLRDLDATLVKLAVIGPIYERYFRKDSYYRQDMRMAYGSIVSSIVKGRVAEITGERGVQLVREYSYSPVFEGLYSARQGSPKQPTA
ncbi:hypothetical protein [Oleiharenicola lentus]|uniref:hypothetical protein n=1 Tax=Oleiharenicola lentus TaxID=2508720 RepID=UPI003F667084